VTKPVDKEGRERDRRIEDALEGKKSGLYRTVEEATKALDIFYSTLKNCAAGCKTCIQVHRDEQTLSPEEKMELVEHIG
jgi:hypothetical protein